jgi:hypothetical protein
MEFYNFYKLGINLASLWSRTEFVLIISGLGVAFALWLGFFLLQGVGIYQMAKGRNFSQKWKAFLPFVNLLYIGKLAGDSQFFGHKVKKTGLHVMIMQIIATLFTFSLVASEAYLWLTCGAPQIDSDLGVGYWPGLTGFPFLVSNFYDIGFYILSILQLVYEIFLIVMLMGLYKQYAPRNYMVLSLLSAFFPVLRFVIIFVLRKRKAIDYEAYARARQEAYMRQRRQYQNPYNNPYQNPYGNSYGQNGYGQSGNRPPEEPFAEFSSSNRNTSSTEDDPDGFFN